MIGILPCAGEASRIHGLPKYLLPIPGGYLLKWHVQQMSALLCDWIRIGANVHNLDLLRQYSWEGEATLAENSATMTQTVLSLRPKSILRDATVIFGMPDTYWLAPDVYPSLVEALNDGADIAVACFPIRDGQHGKVGNVWILDNQVHHVMDKPGISDVHYRYCWGALAWTPAFWSLMQPDDPHVGYALPRAIEAGMNVKAVVIDSYYFDCGTPEEYFELCSLFVKEAPTLHWDADGDFFRYHEDSDHRIIDYYAVGNRSRPEGGLTAFVDKIINSEIDVLRCMERALAKANIKAKPVNLRRAYLDYGKGYPHVTDVFWDADLEWIPE